MTRSKDVNLQDIPPNLSGSVSFVQFIKKFGCSTYRHLSITRQLRCVRCQNEYLSLKKSILTENYSEPYSIRSDNRCHHKFTDFVHAVSNERYARGRLIPMFEGQPTFSQDDVAERIKKVDDLLPSVDNTVRLIRS